MRKWTELLVARLQQLGPTAWVRIGLVGFGLGLLGYLLLAEKPWHVVVPEGRSLKTYDYVAIYFWVAVAINLVIAGFLALSAGIWMQPLPSRCPSLAAVTPRWFWPLVGLAMLVVAVCALPRMNDSFWDDEEYNVRHSVLGRFKSGEEPGTYRFKALGWEETFFDYREPNNHVLHSVLARASLTLWRPFSRPGGLPFQEWPLRIPAWIFGILGVATLAWFLKDAGYPAAGVVAAFLMASHPWILRYASEMRGYSMALALLSAAFVFWRRACSDGHWRWWLGYAFLQWAAIYCYPGVLFTFCVLNVLGLAAMGFSREAKSLFRVQAGRWFAANTFSAMGVLLLMLPLIPQVRAYFEYETSRGIVIGWPWIQSTLAFLLAGTPWVGASAAHPALMTQWGSEPIILFGTIGLAVALGLVGMIRFLRRGWFGVAVVLAIVAPPLLTFAVSVSRKHLIYSSYVIYALPGLIAFVALGVVGIAILLRRTPGGRALAAAWVTTVLAGFVFFTHPTRAWLMTHSLEGIKESVLISRGSLDPVESKDILTASFCIPPYLYDPQMTRLDSVQGLIEMMQLADREGRPLVLNIGMPWAAKAYSPQLWALLQDERLFENRETIMGFDSGLDRIVASYKAGSVAQFDFSDFEKEGR